LVILFILFAFYVVGDILTTIWLIDKHPQGIEGELNPLGILLFLGHGVFGLVIPKILIFIAISVMTIIIDFHYSLNKRAQVASNFSILGLMAWSIIAVTINVMLVYALSLSEGSYESLFLLRIYIVIFAITLGGLIILPKFIPLTLTLVEILFAIIVAVGPIAFSPGIYEFLIGQNIMTLIGYAVSMSGIVGLIIFSMNRLYKHLVQVS
jgi:hypothetical protein